MMHAYDGSPFLTYPEVGAASSLGFGARRIYVAPTLVALGHHDTEQDGDVASGSFAPG
jgi:hypothetical protein